MKINKSIAILFALIFFTFSCSDTDQDTSDNDTISGQPLLRALDAKACGIDFVNNVNEDYQRNSMFYDYFLNGGGVSMGDINNDGLPDLFFTGNDVDDKLYINKGDFQFKDVTKEMGIQPGGWSTGTTMVDINNDGFLDIYVCRSGDDKYKAQKQNLLYINQAGKGFKESGKEYGLAETGQSIDAAFFDYDSDGDLDVWINNHINYDGNVKQLVDNMKASDQSRKRFRSRLYKNENGKFVDATQKAGVSRESASLGVVTSDLNNDGLVDIYVSNDYEVPDYYFQNKGDGTFKEVSRSKVGHTSFFSMGIDAADINNDDNIDMIAVDMTPADHVRNKVLMASMNSELFNFLYDNMNLTKAYMFNTFQMGRGDGHFTEVGNYMGTGQTEWSWAPLFADFDNDGYKDLYITNGYLRDSKDNDFKLKVEEYKKKNGQTWNAKTWDFCTSILKSSPVENKVFRYDGNKMLDVNKTWTGGELTFSNGAAYGDLDQDGDLDLVINNLSQPPSILKNTTKNKGVKIVLENDEKQTELNSKVCLFTSSKNQCSEYYFNRGYQSSVDQSVHFGIPNGDDIQRVEVTWPDGSFSSIDQPVISNNRIVLRKTGLKSNNKQNLNPFFEEKTDKMANRIRHDEMKYDDFKVEVLLPHKYSDLGPALAKGDLDGDGFDDLFLGGSNTSIPQMLFNTKEGFKVRKTGVLADKRYEDLGAHFFDFDGDDDLDLYVASGGGGEIAKHPELTQDRLYENDGNGNLTSKSEMLPPVTSSTKAIVSLDVDKDGDLDLIVCGRNTPGRYPEAAKSYYFENNKTYFRDRTKKVLKDLPGMITDIHVVDLNGDKWDDIIVIGEWIEPQFYINNDGIFNLTEIDALKGHSGWWQSIASGDLDGDGDVDFVLGNMGENNKFHPNPDKPLGLLASDFDDSGSLDIVLTKKYKDMTVPVRGKECSSQQMPMINDKFPTYEGFATSTIVDILGEDKVEKAYNFSATDFGSYIMKNEGNMTFTLQKLPTIVQWSPATAIKILDVNDDNKLDIVIVGNKLNAEPETPAYDGGKGTILLNESNMSFRPVGDVNQTGLLANKDARAMEYITLANGKKALVVANNNGPFQVFVKK